MSLFKTLPNQPTDYSIDENYAQISYFNEIVKNSLVANMSRHLIEICNGENALSRKCDQWN